MKEKKKKQNYTPVLFFLWNTIAYKRVRKFVR